MQGQPRFTPKNYYTRAEAAEKLGISVDQLRYFDKKGKTKPESFELAGNRSFYKIEDIIALKEELESKFKLNK